MDTLFSLSSLLVMPFWFLKMMILAFPTLLALQGISMAANAVTRLTDTELDIGSGEGGGRP